MTRLFYLFTLTLFLNSTFGQNSKDTSRQTIPSRIFKGDSAKFIIDSLKSVVLNDTLKFKSNDLVNINGRTENKNSYSLLFLVDLKYFYLLDNINGTMVSEFVNEILDTSIIESINIIDEKQSMLIFGAVGKKGTIIITTKRKTKINYQVAGLKYNRKKKSGNNFLQLPKNGKYIMIRT